MRFRVRASEAKPEPKPIETNAGLAVLLGTLAWFLALVLILILNQGFNQALPNWWALTCIFGIALGVFGYFKVRSN